MIFVYVNGCITLGPLKKWTEHSQELHLLKIHSSGKNYTKKAKMNLFPDPKVTSCSPDPTTNSSLYY